MFVHWVYNVLIMGGLSFCFACSLKKKKKELVGYTGLMLSYFWRGTGRDQGPRSLGKRETIPNATLSSPECLKMGSNKSHFNVSLIVRDKVTRQCPQITTFENKGSCSKLNQANCEVLLLTTNTSLVPYH